MVVETVRDGTNGALALGGDVIVVDTTDFATVDLRPVVAAARRYCERSVKSV